MLLQYCEKVKKERDELLPVAKLVGRTSDIVHAFEMEDLNIDSVYEMGEVTALSVCRLPGFQSSVPPFVIKSLLLRTATRIWCQWQSIRGQASDNT